MEMTFRSGNISVITISVYKQLITFVYWNDYTGRWNITL